MVYALHPATLDYFFGADTNSLGIVIVIYICMLNPSYSLFSAHCPESAVYCDNDQELGWGSNHYQRPTYYILIAAALMACEGAEAQLSLSNVVLIYASFILVYFLQVMGLLSHPIVTIMWAIEQVSMHILGTTARASDARLVLSFILNGIFVGVSLYLGYKYTIQAMLLTMVLTSFLASHNLFGSIGTKRPFKAVNERLKTKR